MNLNKEERNMTNKELESKVASLEEQLMTLARKMLQNENVTASLLAKLTDEIGKEAPRLTNLENDVETLRALSGRSAAIERY